MFKFFFYSCFGYFFEVLFIFLKSGMIKNRGFLYGPYLPIYGFGAIIISYITRKIDNIFLIFFLSFFLSSILEYISSYIIEKLFNIKLWDYSKYMFNINGRVCLLNSILFGALGVIIHYIDPYINFNNKYFDITIIFILFVDFVFSLKKCIKK